MKCSKCGATISDTANFCTECGMPVQKQNEESIQNQEIQSDDSKEDSQKDDIQESKPLDNPMESDSKSEQSQKESAEKKIEQGVCPNCGEKIRKGASFCVGCGMPIQQQNVESISKQDVQSDDLKSNAPIGNAQESEQSNASQESYVIYEQPQKHKTLKAFIRALTAVIAGIALLYVCLAGYALFKSVFSISEGEELSLAETKSYISPDLKLFDLQGDVKECWQSSSLGRMDEITLVFDRDGRLTNIRNRRSYRDDIEGDGVHYGLARDNEGRIVQFHQVGVFDLGDEINIHYNENGLVAKENGHYIVTPFEITYSYLNGKLINSVFETYYEDGDHLKITYTFSFDNVDEYGNWLTCKTYSKISSYNEDTGEIYEESQDEMTITRKIDYFSDNQNYEEARRTNSDVDFSSNQLENKASKFSEWLYGKWEGHLSTVETTYLEIFSNGTVTEKVIQNDGKVFDKRGEYELYNDTISIIFNNVDDRKRKRIYLLDEKKKKIKFGHIFGGDIYLEKIK